MPKQKSYLIIIITITLIKQTSNSNEDSIKICGNSPNYLLEYYSKGEKIQFDDFKVNRDHAHPFIEITKINNDKNYDEKKKSKDISKYAREYAKRLSPYITFLAFGIITLITFVTILFCWSQPKCCYKDNDNLLKNVTFIICIVFLLGIFSCCISGFVFAERFNFYLNGSTCSIERLFYNIYEGQLNLVNPKWNGFTGILTKLNKLKYLNVIFQDKDIKKYSFDDKSIYEKIEELEDLLEDDTIDRYKITYHDEVKTNISYIQNEIEDKIEEYRNNNSEIIDIIGNNKIEIDEIKLDNAINNIQILRSNFESFKKTILKIYDFFYILLYFLVYFTYQTLYSIIFVIIIVDIFFFTIYYFGCRNTKILKTIKILWYILMIISIISFILGGIYGMISFAVHDSIGYIMYIFGDENYEFNKPIIINSYKDFIGVCIQGNYQYNLGTYYNLNSNDFEEFNDLYIKILNAFNSITNLQKPSFEKLTEIENIKKELLKYKDLDLALKNFTIVNENIHTKTYWVTTLEKCNTIPKDKICCVISFYQYEKGVCSEKDESEDIEVYNQLFVENFKYINNLHNKLTELQTFFSDYVNDMIKKIKLLHSKYVLYFELNKNDILENNDLFSFMKCNFINNDLIAVYKSIYELAYYVRVLGALVLCIAFFSLISAISIQISIMNFDEYKSNNENNDDEEERFSSSIKYKERESSIIKQNKKNKNDNDNEEKNSRTTEMQEFN